MKMQTLKIGENGAALTAYIQNDVPRIKNSSRRPAVLVLPGGGYEFVSETESEPVALAYAAAGFQAFTLEYSVGEKGAFPVPEREVVQALALIRANAGKWHTDRDKIALVGFSAGGHLAASVGVHWIRKELYSAVGERAEEGKPDALVLVYPCITAGEYGYPGIESVHGRDLTTEEKALLSVQNYVGAHTPPVYLCHTAEDTCVPAMNSLLFAQALSKNKIPFELRIFKDGPHGMSLGTRAVRPSPESLPEESRRLLADERIAAYLKRATAKFSAWLGESIAFLFDVFGI